MQELKARGMDDVEYWNPTHTSVGGTHAAFIVRGNPAQYNLPPNPEVPRTYLKHGWTSAAIGAGILFVGSIFAFLGSGR